MGLIEKSDLMLDYDWSSRPGSGPIDRDEIGSTFFDSQSGEHILSLLNEYATKKGTSEKEEVLKAEELIRKELPKDLNNEEDVLDWLWTKMGNTKKTI